MSMIASSVPGRIRLRHAALREPRNGEQLRAILTTWRHVQSVKVSSANGSLTVNYDAAGIAPGRLEQRLLELVRGVAGPATPGATGAPTRVRPPAARRARANRWAKRGMLASLTSSLLLVAAGNRRWHALTGAAFLPALAVHLWVHRRQLLR